MAGIKWVLLALVLSVSSAIGAHANTITAASCNASDVQSAIAQAQNGDTVMIPAGTCTWTTPISISVGIVLEGAGQASSTIIDDVTSGGQALQITINSKQSFRITGMTVQQASGATTNAFMVVNDTPTTPNFRMDHMTFNTWNGTLTGQESLIWLRNVYGVADHITSNLPTGLFQWDNSLYQGVGNYGDNSWAQPDEFGTADAFYVEDSTMSSSTDVPTSVGDCDGTGCRVVVRHNTLTNIDVTWHGTESPGRPRGGRYAEIYDNTFIADGSTNRAGYGFLVLVRSGTLLFWGNTIKAINSGWVTTGVDMELYRVTDHFSPWGACDGLGPYDKNDGVTYASGTASSSSTTDKLVVSGTSPGWTTNQWVVDGSPYSIVDTTKGWGSEITGNGANTITSRPDVGYSGQSHTWASGDSWKILRATICIDQPGRGAGTYLSGTTPSPTGWVNEALDPVYDWDNTWDTTPTSNVMVRGSMRILENRDYYTDDNANGTPITFDGTVGIGDGLLSARPSTCTAGPGGNTPGVAYWATDKNTLYVCTATNTWTAYYKPYTYPHPLTLSSGTGSAPASPTNLQVTSVH